VQINDAVYAKKPTTPSSRAANNLILKKKYFLNCQKQQWMN